MMEENDLTVPHGLFYTFICEGSIGSHLEKDRHFNKIHGR